MAADETTLSDTPEDYYSEEIPASRGQHKLIAYEACKLLGISQPDSRLDASIALVKLRKANLANADRVDHDLTTAAPRPEGPADRV